MTPNGIDTFDIYECHYQSQMVARVRAITYYLKHTGADFSDPINFNLYYSDEVTKHKPLHQDDDETPLDQQEYYFRNALFKTDKIDRVYSYYEGKFDTRRGYLHMGGKADPMMHFIHMDPFREWIKLSLNEKQKKNLIFRNMLPTQKNKVCVWGWRESDVTTRRYNRKHALSNKHRTHKTEVFSEDEWNILIEYLKSRFTVVELFYRTPIREVFYHLRTCDFSIGTTGMYHNTSAGLGNPQISLGSMRPPSFNFLCMNEHHIVKPSIDQLTTDSFFDESVEKARNKQL